MRTKPKLSSSSIVTALILAVILSIPVLGKQSSSGSFVFEVTIQSSVDGTAQIFYDIGRGIREADSASVHLKSGAPAVYRFRIPRGDYRALRFDPIDREGTVKFFGAKILDRQGMIVQAFGPAQFRAAQQIDSLLIDKESVQVVTIAGANDPILEVSFDRPFSLRRDLRGLLLRLTMTFFGIFVLCGGLLWLMDELFPQRRERLAIFWRNMVVWADHRRKIAIVGVGIFAALLSCYPVVFFGKSFVSPNIGTVLLYEHFPTLPGYDNPEVGDPRGSDVGAIMWQHVPYSVIQSRAILEYFELPLWNRYNSSGTVLLGQGQSMFGDPLHAIVLFAGGASWAWDLKYLLAKIIFAAGCGLMVYEATRHLASSLILTLSSPFIGFFSYRLNHPAFFSLCYAPCILYCWFGFIRSRKTKENLLWILGLVLSNWMEMNSGTAKEAYMLLLFMNLCGLIAFLASKGESLLILKKVFLLVYAGLVFVLISAPVWLTFWGVMRQSYTSYNIPSARQLPPDLLIGLFDDFFYRQFSDAETVFDPSANLFMLFGVLWSLAELKKLVADRIYLAVGLSSLIPFALVYAVVSPRFIMEVPFLGNVAHIDNTFSCVLIIHLIVLAGFGFKVCWDQLGRKEWSSDLAIVILMLSLLLGLYFGLSHTTGREVSRSNVLYRYLLLELSAFISVPIIARAIIVRGVSTAPAFLILFLGLFVMHFRYGMHLKVGLDKYLINPGVRVNLEAKSPAIEFTKSDAEEPFRTVGFGAVLFPGYNGVFGVESPYGADAMNNPFYHELMEASNVERIWDWRYVIAEKTLAQLEPIYNFLNTRYYLATTQDKPKDLPGLKRRGAFDLEVYQSDSVWPRAFFSDTLSRYDTPAQFVDMIKDGDGAPFAAIQQNELLGHPGLENMLKDQKQRRVGRATHYKLTANTTSFDITAPSKGIIVLGEAFLDKDFRVSVNGQPRPYFRANHIYKGVVISGPGTYHISFEYWPQHFTLSLWMAAAGVFLMAVLIVFFVGNSRRNQHREIVLPKSQSLVEREVTTRC